TAESNTRLSGSATTTVSRADYGLDIPSVPMVANVSEQVKIEISFMAASS
ncbi:MAG: YceI family protein, partial [Oscillochloris sp.]|nr:YceI family protein [Oscillochloris sp.]